MSELDDRLQNSLQELENGTHLGVSKAVSSDGGELAELGALAARLREMPHLEMDVAVARLQRGEVVAAALRQARPASGTANPRPWWRLPVAGRRLAAVLVIAAFAFAFVGWRLADTARRAGAVTLTDVAGLVEVALAEDGSEWAMVSEQMTLRAGQRIRTGSASSASLVFFEGTTTRLGPNTELVLSKLDGGWGKTLRVGLTQSAGKTTHQVVPLQGTDAFFAVHTPAGAASVHGTTFSVAVDLDGRSLFAVDSGVVEVVAAGENVLLGVGQATVAAPGEALQPAAYQFRGQGQITQMTGTTWIVGGLPVTVIDQTAISGNPGLGDHVEVAGRIMDQTIWLADRIDPAAGGEAFFSFSGPLQAFGNLYWQIGGVSLLVDSQTQLGDGLELGALVRASFTVLENGDLHALRIERVDDTPEQTPTPTATPDPQAQPSLSFEPDELETAGCGNEFEFVGVLYNEGEEPDAYAANVQLGYLFVLGAEYVEAVILSPSFWEVIPAGESVEFSAVVRLGESWNIAPDEAQVKLRIVIAGETNRPGHHRTRLTLTIVSQCEETPTPSATPSPTPTLTPTPTATPGPSPTPGGGDCTGADPHPTGTRLAERYGVSYDEIMAWFCSGFGFGEIDLAYSLSEQTGMPVADIFAMKQSGMGWGNVKKDLLGPADAKPTKVPRPDKDKDKDKTP